MQTCIVGQWVDSTTCTGTDVCANGSTQNGSTACGLNSEGVYAQDCISGAWVDNTTCTGTDVCTNGDSQVGTLACGFNNGGMLLEDCTSGAWVEGTTCSIPDQVSVCANGACTTSIGSLGRTLNVTTANLNNTGYNVAVVDPGASVSFAISGNVVANNTSCPGCITQFYARMNGVFGLCLGSTVGGYSFNKSATFTAPADPGIYFINHNSGWQLNCGTSTSGSTALSSYTIATLIVRDPSITYSSLGRTVTMSSINMNSSGTDSAAVSQGSSVGYSIAGDVVDSNTSCPGCFTQFYARINGVFGLCLGNGTGNWSFNEITTFTAPAETGIYFVNPASGWAWGCGTSTSASTNMGTSTMGYLFVHP
ncbi:MAG TPA: hypothetical protein EYN52_00280 [Alphaproteobacteria bacterium]|nr:hypothetical protein [Alphaproteobacteria bacterium]